MIPKIFPLDVVAKCRYPRRMKSFVGMLFTLLVFTLVVGGAALIWYLSDTAEFSRVESKPVPRETPPEARRVSP
jgi:hypothetical protein